MATFEQALSDYGKAIAREKPFPAILGAYISGAFRIIVPTNPALAYVRHLDNTPATAYHHNRVDLTLDPTVAANQNTSIALYYDEYDHLAIWGPEPSQAGAILQSDPNAGSGAIKAVIAGTNVTVNNTDPTRPIVSASGGGGGGGGGANLFTLSTQPDVNNTTTETTILGAGFGSLTLPIGWFSNGRGIRVRLWGALGTKASSPGTLFVRMTLAGNEVYQLGTLTLPAGYAGIGYIDIDLWCFDASVPASVQVRGNGIAHYGDGNFPISILEWANGGASYNIDGTVTNVIDVTVTFSVADVANDIAVYGGSFTEIPVP